jgi:hypothetical protein
VIPTSVHKTSIGSEFDVLYRRSVICDYQFSEAGEFSCVRSNLECSLMTAGFILCQKNGGLFRCKEEDTKVCLLSR